MKSPIINITLPSNVAPVKGFRGTPPLPQRDNKLTSNFIDFSGNIAILFVSIGLLVIQLFGRYENMKAFVYLMPLPKIVFKQSIVSIGYSGKSILKNLLHTVGGFFFYKTK